MGGFVAHYFVKGNMNVKSLQRWIIGLVLLFGLAGPARAAAPEKERRETLCGQLVFLTQLKTGQRLLGLTPCSGSHRPLIFIARPGKLYNYYRFKDVVIAKGDRVMTQEYGAIEYFIEKFDSFVEIQDCSACQAKAPTRTPIPRLAALNCGEYLVQNGGQNYFPELADEDWQSALAQRWEDYAAGSELRQRCGDDSECQSESLMLLMGESLGERLAYTPRQLDMLIAFLYEQLLKPETAAACPDFAWSLRFLTAGLSRQGLAVDMLSAASPATLIVTDRLGRQAGLLANGATVEEIPGSKAAVTSQNKLVLLPGGLFSEPPAAEMIATWTADGAARLELAVNRPDEVWLASFADTHFTAGGWGRLDLAGEPPWLQMVAPGGSIEAPAGSIAASSFTKLSVEVNKMPSPSPWPTETARLPTNTNTPAPAPSATPTQPAATPIAQALFTATVISSAAPTASAPSRPSVGCPAAVALPIALTGIWGIRKRKQSR